MKRMHINQRCALAAQSVNAPCCEATCVHPDICTVFFMGVCGREGMEVQI